MKLSDAIKLQDGDKIRCGPNDCGCDGRVYVVSRVEHLCGCVGILHDGNKGAFVWGPHKNCDVADHPSPYWGGRKGTDRNLARNLRRA